MTKPIRVPLEDAFKTAWEITKKNFWFLAGLTVIYMIFSMPYDMNDGGLSINLWGETTYEAFSAQEWIFSVIMTVIGVILEIGTLSIALKMIDGKDVTYADLFHNGNKFLRFILGSFLYVLVVIAGLILLIVPGIIFALKYQYYSYFIIDKNMGVFASLEASGKATQGVKWQLFGYAILIMLINILGVALLGVGLLVALPVTWLSGAFIYRFLSKRAGKHKASDEPKLESADETPTEKDEATSDK